MSDQAKTSSAGDSSKARKARRRAIAEKKLRLIWGAERVFLAWIRTAIALIALGFLVARLGGLLQIVGVQSAESRMTPLEATLGGIVLMALGGIISLVATWRFRLTHRNISSGKIFLHSAQLSVFVGVITAIVSLILIASFWTIAMR